jgi:hypothetical protein
MSGETPGGGVQEKQAQVAAAAAASAAAAMQLQQQGYNDYIPGCSTAADSYAVVPVNSAGWSQPAASLKQQHLCNNTSQI